MGRIMPRVAAVFATLMVPVLPAAAQAVAPVAPIETADASLVARGAYLARAGDCAACHRALDTGGRAFAGGYVIASPMGNIIAPNITPSRDKGIGTWSFADFDRAMRKGIRPDGARLYPAMPYTDYQGLTDADMHALYAYFMHGVQPVDVATPATALPFPFNIRAIMIPWNLMFRSDKPFLASTGSTAEVARGQYLVETLGHCGSCHTPRNLLMAEKSSEALGGGDIGGWHAPNITSDPVSGIGGWTATELATYLRAGQVPGKGVAAGGMGEAVEHSLQYMTGPDLAAIAAYLKSVKPIRDSVDTKPGFAWTGTHPVSLAAYETGDGDQASLAVGTSTNGATLYAGACGACHGLDGAGTKDRFYPALTGSSATGASNPANLVMTILHGVDRRTADEHAFMPAFAEQLNDAQVAAVANHVLTQFGNKDVHVTSDQVATLRSGGTTPLLLRLMPWIYAVSVAVVIALAALVIRTRRRHGAVAV